jgi:hypothetical protein
MDHSVVHGLMCGQGGETMMLYKQIEWSLVSFMELVRRDHGVLDR